MIGRALSSPLPYGRGEVRLCRCLALPITFSPRGCGVRQETQSPGPYRSLRELSLTGLVGSDIWRPPTFVGYPGSMIRRQSRIHTYVRDLTLYVMEGIVL